MVRCKSFGGVCSRDECRNYEQNWGARLCFLQKSQRVLVFVEPWSRRALVFVREVLCDWGASIFVKLGIPPCLSCCLISFCLFLHLPIRDMSMMYNISRCHPWWRWGSDRYPRLWPQSFWPLRSGLLTRESLSLLFMLHMFISVFCSRLSILCCSCCYLCKSLSGSLSLT